MLTTAPLRFMSASGSEKSHNSPSAGGSYMKLGSTVCLHLLLYLLTVSQQLGDVYIKKLNNRYGNNGHCIQSPQITGEQM